MLLPLRLAIISALVSLSCASQPPPTQALQPATSPGITSSSASTVWRKPVVIGASVSAGLRATPLHTLIASCLGRSEVKTFADTFLFRAPHRRMTMQLRRAQDADPSLVIAIDVLFWSVHSQPSPGERRHSLQRALRQLNVLQAPIIVGDLPALPNASDFLLPHSRRPSTEERNELNRLIHGYAAKRANVMVFALSVLSETLSEQGEVVVVGHRHKTSELMHSDGLHVTDVGLLYLLAHLDDFVDSRFNVPARRCNLERAKESLNEKNR